MSGSCEGLTGLVFGHRFKPRYDESKSASNTQGTMYGNVPKMLEAGRSVKQTYVQDVCVRCGEIRRRE